MDVSRQKKTKTLFDLFSDLIHFLKMPQILYNDSYENIDRRMSRPAQFKKPWTKENVVEVNSKMESALWKMLEEF